MQTPPPIAWDDVRIFLAALRAGSLGAAAAALGVDPATASRRLAAFERAMGTALVTRGRDGVRATEDGAALRALAEKVEEPMLALLRRRDVTSDAAPGRVRLATSSILSAGLLAGHAAAFARAAPEVQLELIVGRRLVDLARREADVALRLRPAGARIAEPSTVARKVADVGFALYGTRDEARAREARFIRYAGFEPGARQVDALADGRPAAAVVDDVPTALALARGGCGLAVLPCFLGDPERGLVRVGEVLERHRLYVATLPELRRVPRVDRVVRWLAEVARAEGERLAG